jgi:hypothetical protein
VATEIWVVGTMAAVAVPVSAGFCFCAYLRLIRFVVVKTGSTDGLKDVAVAMRAYKVPLLNRAIRPPRLGARRSPRQSSG